MDAVKQSAEDILRQAPSKIWLRFYATHGLPQGSTVPIIERNDEQVEARQRQEAVDQGIDPDRLKRPGDKPDSGRQIIRDVRFVSVRQLVEDLKACGYRLTQAFVNKTRRTDGSGFKTVYTFIFETVGEELTFSAVDQAWLERCLAGTYDHISVFKNPKRDGLDGEFNRREDTLNVRGLKSGMPPQKMTRMHQPGEYSHDHVS